MHPDEINRIYSLNGSVYLYIFLFCIYCYLAIQIIFLMQVNDTQPQMPLIKLVIAELPSISGMQNLVRDVAADLLSQARVVALRMVVSVSPSARFLIHHFGTD